MQDYPNHQFDVFINANAELAMDLGEQGLKQLVSDNVSARHIYILPPEELFDRIRVLATDNVFILVGGGDGTIKSAAMTLKQFHRPFGVLPMGTMNLLARDLGIPLDLKEALQAYERGVKELKIDSAEVNGRVFLCAACLGIVPEMSRLREENRGKSLPVLAQWLTLQMFQEMNKVGRRKIHTYLDGAHKVIKSASLVVSNNSYDCPDEWGAGGMRRSQLRCGKLSLYSLATKNMWDKLRVLFRLGIGGWQKDSSIKEHKAKQVMVQTMRDYEMVTLDGEVERLKTPLVFNVMPKSLRVLAPDFTQTKNV